MQLLIVKLNQEEHQRNSRFHILISHHYHQYRQTMSNHHPIDPNDNMAIPMVLIHMFLRLKYRSNFKLLLQPQHRYQFPHYHYYQLSLLRKISLLQFVIILLFKDVQLRIIQWQWQQWHWNLQQQRQLIQQLR